MGDVMKQWGLRGNWLPQAERQFVDCDDPIRVLICDPEPLMRAGIKAAIDRHGDLKVVGELESFGEIEVEARQFSPNILVLNSTALEHVHAKMTQGLQKSCSGSDLPCVVLVDPDDTHAMLFSLKAGFRSCVSKFETDDLPYAMRAVRDGQCFLSTGLTTILFESIYQVLQTFTAHAPIDVAALSVRELEVLRLLGEGISNTKIAHQLRIKETTIRSHVNHILTKLNLQSREQAIILGYEHCKGSLAR